jgi:hypothetical protein
MINPVKQLVDIQLAKHQFVFKRLNWSDLKSLPKATGDHRRHLLSHVLVSVSGVSVNLEEAKRLIDVLPEPILRNVFVMYKGGLDDRRILSSSPPWSAPSANTYVRKLEKEEEENDKEVDDVEQLLKTKFGAKAFEEEKELMQNIVRASGYAGAQKREADHLQELHANEEEV